MQMTQQRKQITADYGNTDYYKHYAKSVDNPITPSRYKEIIDVVNKGVIDLMLNENLEFKIPKLSMTLCIRKFKTTPRIVNGKLLNSTPVDWKATNELWESNEEAKDKKILLRYLNRHSSKYVFKIKLIKFGALYKNKKHYEFKPSRGFARSLAKRIFDESKDDFDTYNLY